MVIPNDQLLLNDFLSMLHTVFTNMSFLTRNENFHLIPAPATERTMKGIFSHLISNNCKISQLIHEKQA